MVCVAYREGVGQREMEWDVGPFVVAHHIGTVRPVGLTVRGQPLVHFSVVERLMLHGPGVRRGRDLLHAVLFRSFEVFQDVLHV